MGSLYLWGRSIQEMSGNDVIGRSIYGVVVIDGLLYSRFYGIVIIFNEDWADLMTTCDYTEHPTLGTSVNSKKQCNNLQ